MYQGRDKFDDVFPSEKLVAEKLPEHECFPRLASNENQQIEEKAEKVEVLIPAWCTLHDKDMWWNDVYDPVWIKYKTRRRKIFAFRIM